MIDNSTGKTFPQAAINGGYVFILFSPVFLLDSSLIGVVLLMVGLLVSFSISGVRIDTQNKRFKEYTRYYWIKFGNWIAQEEYPFITIITDRESLQAFSFSKDTSDLDEVVYGMYLLNKSKTNKILIKKFIDQDKAMLELPIMAKEIGLKVINL